MWFAHTSYLITAKYFLPLCAVKCALTSGEFLAGKTWSQSTSQNDIRFPGPVCPPSDQFLYMPSLNCQEMTVNG